MTCRLVFLLPILYPMSFPMASARAGDYQIVPGKRIGQIEIGMTRDTVSRILGKPSRTRRLHGGEEIDTWLSATPVTPTAFAARALKRNYVSVFFQDRRVVQIEASSPRFAVGGLTTDTNAEAWQRRYSPSRSFMHMWLATNPDMNAPACKHYLQYRDAVPAGLAWKQGAWGCLAPEPGRQPETIIVHAPGGRVRLNPNDADDYSGTGHRVSRQA